ncbi:MAG: ATP-binding protein [Luteibacter sp.]|uniref:ATP-binding protein n=1 Tax=Luteibacter sp. TaxID=1886636 RepID=UPI00280970F6|nr:ATP-binding protein [Luteibacter sp.]MDQ7996924.1 ATP-binding protein [Luteibacter sp.]MDQ8049296.1 ATP-binding protein [Luteibacter sp.]
MTDFLSQQQQLMDLAQDCVKRLDLEGRVLSVNVQGVALFGVENAAALIGRAWWTLWPADFQPTAISALNAARSGRTSRFIGATTYDDDQRRWWSVAVGPLADDNGRITGIGAVSRDVTERVQLEASLDAINGTLRERLAEAQSTIDQAERRERALHEELTSAERTVVAVHQENAELHDRLDLAAMAQSAAERVAQQAQKGEAIGQLVAGISHDFNNNLQTVISALDALITLDELTPRSARYAGFALTAARHAALMSRRLLAFTRVHPYAPVSLDLVQTVGDILPMMDGTLGRDMRVELVEPTDALPIFADGHSIQQGVMNLCVNARDACQGRGTVRVTFGAARVEADAATVILPEGDYVYVEVADDGPGMTEEVRERLFQPFFTTKAPEKGTGLGMAQVLGLMRQASGSVEVQTTLGEGTRVRLLFPRSRMPVEL